MSTTTYIPESPLKGATLCTFIAVLLVLPRPELGAACALLLLASYLLLSHYSQPAAATAIGSNGSAAATGASAQAIADLVASKISNNPSESEELLNLQKKAREAAKSAEEWKAKCMAARSESDSWSASARELSGLLNALGVDHPDEPTSSKATDCASGDETPPSPLSSAPQSVQSSSLPMRRPMHNSGSVGSGLDGTGTGGLDGFSVSPNQTRRRYSRATMHINDRLQQRHDGSRNGSSHGGRSMLMGDDHKPGGCVSGRGDCDRRCGQLVAIGPDADKPARRVRSRTCTGAAKEDECLAAAGDAEVPRGHPTSRADRAPAKDCGPERRQEARLTIGDA